MIKPEMIKRLKKTCVLYLREMCVLKNGRVYCLHNFLADSESVWNGLERRKIISHIFTINLMYVLFLVSLRRCTFITLKPFMFQISWWHPIQDRFIRWTSVINILHIFSDKKNRIKAESNKTTTVCGVSLQPVVFSMYLYVCIMWLRYVHSMAGSYWNVGSYFNLNIQ